MNPKKYAQHKTKGMGSTEAFKHKNKENETEIFHKKFSVGQHGISQEMDFFPSKKNITQEKISVCLDHSQSQNKTFAFEKSKSQSNIRQLNYLLENSQGNVKEILEDWKEENSFRNDDFKRLVNNLIEKFNEKPVEEEEKSQKIELTDHILKPYIEQELMLLEKNYLKLKTRGQELEDISKLSSSQKTYITDTLKKLEQEQRAELEQLKALEDDIYSEF